MGTKFGQQEAIPENEYIVELHKKFEAIRERIQSYDKICQDFNEIRTKFESYSKKVDALVCRICILETSALDMNRNLENKAASFKDAWSKSNETISLLEKEIEKSQKKSSERHDSLLESIRQVDEKSKSYAATKCEGSDLQIHVNSTNEGFNKLSQRIQEQNYIASKINESVEDTKSVLAKKIDEIDEQNKNMQKVALSFSRLESKMKMQFDNYVDEARREQSKNYDDLRKDLKASEERIVGTPNSNAAVESRILNRLEINSLDSSNSLLLARNLETKIKVLEKRIEQLNLNLEKTSLNS